MHVGMITYVEVSAAGWGCFVLAQLLQNLWRTGQMLHCAFCTGFLFHLVPWRRSLQWRKWAQEGLIWKTNWAFSSSSKPHLCPSRLQRYVLFFFVQLEPTWDSCCFLPGFWQTPRRYHWRYGLSFRWRCQWGVWATRCRHGEDPNGSDGIIGFCNKSHGIYLLARCWTLSTSNTSTCDS